MHRQPKVSLIVHSLQSNPIVRAAPVGRALETLGFEVEVLGMIPKGESVYRPYRNAFEYKLEEVRGSTLFHARSLAKKVTGDVVYAFKPNTTTLLPALIASSLGFRKPLLLDIEDDDALVCEQKLTTSLRRNTKELCKNPKHIMAIATHQLRRTCTLKTVSTTSLKNFYGGDILLHGPDERKNDPTLPEFEKSRACQYFGLPEDKQLVVFAGGPGYHKGFDLIVDAVARRQQSMLVLAGNPECKDFKTASKKLQDRCINLGFIDNKEMPRLLAAVDIVPIPQRDIGYARAQLPAKLIEAMAMAKPVIVTEVGDLPSLVGGNAMHGKSGWVIQPDSVSELYDALSQVADDAAETRQRAENSRRFFMEHASVTANAALLRKIFCRNKRMMRLYQSVLTNPEPDDAPEPSHSA